MLMIVSGVIPWRDCGRTPGCRDPEIQEMWGCKGETSEYPIEVETEDGGTETVRRCPWALVNESGAWTVMRYWGHYKNHHLPGRGGVDDQPLKLMAAIEFVEQHVAHYRKMAEDGEGEE